ncbi:MAG: helix-turn-helix transcriptional regulator [Oscillospiraceae bacterium]|nr:helix-turn-helix transcriptional regulator [Oscillospiraceae bacterium]
MERSLLVCKQVVRDAFHNESFVGTDDILALVVRGSFVFDCGSGQVQADALQAVNFRHGVRYQRHVIQPVELYMFRYRAENSLFGSGLVTFRNQERIRSTIQLLHLSDSIIQPDDFACKRALFADLVNQYRLENCVQSDRIGDTDEVIAAAIAHINANLHRKLNLAELAAEHYLSYVQFSRRFKAATGSTPQDYVIGLRLKKAQSLLSESDLPIHTVAQYCGFANEYYFSNFFRKHSRLSPTRYRTLIKGTDHN